MCLDAFRESVSVLGKEPAVVAQPVKITRLVARRRVFEPAIVVRRFPTTYRLSLASGHVPRRFSGISFGIGKRAGGCGATSQNHSTGSAASSIRASDCGPC